MKVEKIAWIPVHIYNRWGDTHSVVRKNLGVTPELI